MVTYILVCFIQQYLSIFTINLPAWGIPTNYAIFQLSMNDTSCSIVEPPHTKQHMKSVVGDKTTDKCNVYVNFVRNTDVYTDGQL